MASHTKAGTARAGHKAVKRIKQGPRAIAGNQEGLQRKPTATVNARLKKYRAMRDFARTPEPADAETKRGEPMRFVIQEHHASHLHWDFRLEHDGVLVSWALPKGLPLDPKKNHLAVRTEDHPLSYIDFAGDIPAGNYGAGHVDVWDSGTYERHKFRDKEVMVTLHGTRAQGKYVLFQTSGKNWMIHRMDPPRAGYEPMPQNVPPMLAKAASLPQDDAEYAYEIKWDGIRTLVYAEGGRIRLSSRNGNDISAQYPELRPLGTALGARSALLDGEIVAFDPSGRPSFQRLQTRMGLNDTGRARLRREEAPVVLMIFDILYLEGRSLLGESYRARRAQLDALSLNGPAWQTPSFHIGDGAAMLAASVDQRLEGIVAKRIDSLYEPGKRPGTWLKIKNQQRQEFVIGGYTKGKRHAIGSLLLGYFDVDVEEAVRRRAPQRLLLAGGVGTGFTETMLDDLQKELAPLEQVANPFATKPGKPDVTFVTPTLVAEIEFTEWTRAGTLRHPSFKGLRFDKSPQEVLREIPETPNASQTRASAALHRNTRATSRKR